MTRLLAAGFVAALALAGTATAASSKDPRLCQVHSPTVCGRIAATFALQKAMAVHDHQAAWTGVVNCSGNPAILRWRCTFHNNIDKGSAVITYGKAPAFKVAVKLTVAPATP